MTLSDWGAVAGIVGVVVSVVGFSIAIWQLARTADASEATRDAVRQTEQRLVFNYLLVLLPQFRILEGDLDGAVESGDRKHAIRALVNFAQVATEVAAMLRAQEGTDADVADRLEVAARNASQAKADLVTDPSKTPADATVGFRRELADLFVTVSALMARVRTEGGRA